MGREPDLVILANVVSRVEALCLADMLDAEGIPVLVQGYHHGTVLVIPPGARRDAYLGAV